ncbi:MAG: winged helix DNA-binding domain-containing protein [Gemmatimonadota bacterium]|nr:winged helix DNA-binding domain-containing protein [Gemmatimonadota bacterium]
MGAIQAQDYNSVRWAVALRIRGEPTEADIEQSIADGSIIRTHALRGTWQIIAPPDVRWMLSLVAPRVKQSRARRHQQLELDAPTFGKSCTVLVKAIEQNGAMTRDELARALQRAGISTAGQRLPHILGSAELEGLLCGGPRRGKQFTWRLLDTPSPRWSQEEALAELVGRFFQSRGPATLDDFCWWSGLRVSDARLGIESGKSSLEMERIGGRDHWRRRKARRATPRPRALLLPDFDEWLVGYRNRDAVVDPKHRGRVNAGGGIIGMCVALDGNVVGSWRRTLGRRGVAVEVELFQKVSEQDVTAIERAVERYAAFVEREPAATVVRVRKK